MLNYNISVKDTASTSFNQYRQRSFKYKVFSDELPILSYMRRHRPDIYPSEVCLSCQKYNESQIHFWTCPSHQDQWYATLNSAADMLMQLLQKITSRNLPTLDIIKQCLYES